MFRAHLATVLLALVALTAGLACGGAPPAAPARDVDEIEDPFVIAHNEARAAAEPAPVPALPPVTFDAELAATAQTHASRCVFEHASTPYGENIAFFSGDESTPADVVAMWVSEVADYNAADNSCDDGKVCGHYTQVVWRGSTFIGCGVSSCPLFGTTGLLWVCNYDPPGNVIGQRPY